PAVPRAGTRAPRPAPPRAGTHAAIRAPPPARRPAVPRATPPAGPALRPVLLRAIRPAARHARPVIRPPASPAVRATRVGVRRAIPAIPATRTCSPAVLSLNVPEAAGRGPREVGPAARAGSGGAGARVCPAHCRTGHQSRAGAGRGRTGRSADGV